MNNSNLLGRGGQVNQSTKPNRKSKSNSGGSKKRQGVKVVYISNPMKVRTSASEFRALVQELTGQDSELPDPARVSEYSSPDNNFISDVLPHSTGQIGGDHHHHHRHHHALDLEVAPSTQEEPESSSSNTQFHYQLYDDLFVPEMIGNFEGLLP